MFNISRIKNSLANLNDRGNVCKSDLYIFVQAFFLSLVSIFSYFISNKIDETSFRQSSMMTNQESKLKKEDRLTAIIIVYISKLKFIKLKVFD